MRYFLSLFLLFSLANISIFGQKKEEKLVRASFENYKSAILNDKGEEAVNYVDSRTLNYYAMVLDLVKTADSVTVDKLTGLDKLMVFSIRHRTSKEDILNFNGKSLLVYAIQQGMVGKNSVAKNEIGEVTVDKGFAKGQFIANGQKTPFDFHFYKEEGNWKMDLTSIFPISAVAIKEMIKNSEQDENEYYFYLLELVSGKKPGAEIWQKVQ